MEQSRNECRLSVGKIALGMPKRRWEDNIKMDLRKVGCDPVPGDLIVIA